VDSSVGRRGPRNYKIKRDQKELNGPFISRQMKSAPPQSFANERHVLGLQDMRPWAYTPLTRPSAVNCNPRDRATSSGP
jgi:hypothetical protein